MTLALVQAGARVAMLDVNEAWLEQTANDVREVGGDNCVLTQVSDVSDPDSAEEAVRKTIAGLGGLHILINNAGIINPSGHGIGTRTNFWDITPETWSKIVCRQLQRSVLHGPGRCGPHGRPEVGPSHRRHDQH